MESVFIVQNHIKWCNSCNERSLVNLWSQPVLYFRVDKWSCKLYQSAAFALVLPPYHSSLLRHDIPHYPLQLIFLPHDILGKLKLTASTHQIMCRIVALAMCNGDCFPSIPGVKLEDVMHHTPDTRYTNHKYRLCWCGEDNFLDALPLVLIWFIVCNFQRVCVFQFRE